jgi:hypothetical protein
MSTVTRDNFGPLIAYLVPGGTIIWSLSYFSTSLRVWFVTSPTDAPTLGGLLYLTVASLSVGMVVNAVRWTVVDSLHSVTGIPSPKLDFSKLGQNVEAFNLLISIHYQHYQFYANMLIASAFAYICYRVRIGLHAPLGLPDAGFVLLEAVFFVTSRDTLMKYYTRIQQLLMPIDASEASFQRTKCCLERRHKFRQRTS